MKTKKCSRCGVEKPLNEFYPRLLSKKDGVTATCKQCIAAYKSRKNDDTREKCNF